MHRQDTYRWFADQSNGLELSYTSLGYDGCDDAHLSRSKGIACFCRMFKSEDLIDDSYLVIPWALDLS